MPETTWDVINDSLGLLKAAAAMIGNANRKAPTPCTEWTVTQVLQHAAGDQLAWAAALGVGAGPTSNPFAPSGHLETSVNDLLGPSLATARTAWAAINHDNQAVPTPLPQGELPAPVAAAACGLDAAIHAWDIAAALGQPGFLSYYLAEQLLPTQTITEPLRQFGVYATTLSTQPVDGHAAELLRYLGRDPQWRPADQT